MKTISTLFILTSLTLSGIAQVYQPFPSANAMWRENATGFQCSCCSEYQYNITGDTVINSMTYHKLQKTGIKYQEDMIGNCTSNIQYIINQYEGCIRNDITNKKIFFVSPFSTSDTVLYDFNLSIGDTVPPSPLNNYGAFVNVVTEIDSIYLGNVYRKRFKLDSCMLQQLYYIEGIGSTYGLLSPTMCPFEAIYNLLCFTNNSQTVYPDSSTTCSIITSLNEQKNDYQLNIFPNPTTGELTIKTSFNSYQLNIFNSTGQIIFSSNINSSNYVFDTSILSPGLFLIQLTDNNKFVYDQLIIKQ